MEEERIESISREIAAGITPKRFPDDFLDQNQKGEITRIPAGTEVSMYRELEGVFVMIDGERLFFNQPIFAKFIFYCAKSGITEVHVPEAKDAKKAIKGLEQEINGILFSIDQEMEKYRVPEINKRETLLKILEILRLSYYDDIVSSEEDLW